MSKDQDKKLIGIVKTFTGQLTVNVQENVTAKLNELMEENSKKKKFTPEEVLELVSKAFLTANDDIKSTFTSVKSGKKKKDGPKRPPTAYNLYIKEKMEELKNKNSDIAPKDLMAEAAKNWPKDKENFIKQFNEKKT
jgi:hypothetical protein